MRRERPGRYSGAVPESTPSRRAPAPIQRIDPGWLFLLAGLGLLGATLLLPAGYDLALARHQRDAAMLEADRREARVARYAAYLEALERQDPLLIRHLAAVHLNLLPVGVEPLPGSPPITLLDTDPLPAMEPAAVRAGPMPEPRSRLEGWAVDPRARLWLLAGGSLCVLIGLLPPASRRAGRARAARTLAA